LLVLFIDQLEDDTECYTSDRKGSNALSNFLAFGRGNAYIEDGGIQVDNYGLIAIS
jgi:hypothetical protein